MGWPWGDSEKLISEYALVCIIRVRSLVGHWGNSVRVYFWSLELSEFSRAVWRYLELCGRLWSSLELFGALRAVWICFELSEIVGKRFGWPWVDSDELTSGYALVRIIRVRSLAGHGAIP